MSEQNKVVSPITIELNKPSVPFYYSKQTDEIVANGIYLLGFEFDGTACFRKGTKAGPDALREVADGIETFSPYLNRDVREITYYDLGNLSLEAEMTGDEIKDNENKWQRATDDFLTQFSDIDLAVNNIKMVVLGGEHSISYAPIKKYLEQYPDLVLVHLDAHADLRDGFTGYHYSHASIIYRVLEHFGPGHELIQYGIRSGTQEEFQWMRENKTIKNSRQEFLDAIRAIPADRPIYLTFDLDYFDPSFFPGTGTPEPGGEDFHSFVSFCKILREKNFVGCDVVELSPEIDSTGNSDVFAAKVIRELLICLNS